MPNDSFPSNSDALTNVEIADDSIVCTPSVIIVPDQSEAGPLLACVQPDFHSPESGSVNQCTKSHEQK